MRNLLVLGGTGQLGSALVETATASGIYNVTATYLTSAPPSGGAWVRCDLLDANSLVKLVNDVRPDLVINAAYRQNGDGADEICSIGAERAAQAAAAAGARFVHISTDLVFDGELGRPYDESDPVSPLNDYGRAKAKGERLVLSADPTALIVRTSILYGASGSPQEALVRRAVDAGDIAFFTDEWRSPVEVGSLADGVLKLADTGASGILHLAGNERIDRLTFAKLLAGSLGLPARELRGGLRSDVGGARPGDVTLNSSTAFELLGYELPGPTNVLG